MSTSTDAPGDAIPRDGDNPGIRLARVGGVPVYLSPSWFVIAAIIVLTFGPNVRSAMPQLGAAGAYLVALVYAVLLAISVLCHEAAHAVVARFSGYAVARVVVNLWGGHTAFTTPAPSPGRSALVSVSGPVTNALLALLGWVLLDAVSAGVGWLLLFAWTISNAFVAVFNLLPGLPLDGGFLVDALIWKLTGRRSAGLVAAGWGGRIVTLAGVAWFVVLPLASGDRPSLWTVAWFAFIGAFLWSGASSAIAAGRSLAVLERIPLPAVVRPVTAVPVDGPAGAVLAALQARPGSVPILVDQAGAPCGLVDPQAWQRVAPDQAADAPAAALLLRQPAGWLAPYDARPGATVAPYLAALVENPYGVVVLTDPAGRPVAALTSADVERAGAGEPPGGEPAGT
ncbi:MAG: hypothetical protein LCH98_03230 [Actinobacteria bacterium]|nr:hypothetical protein [Actinomycetota bacterium]